MDATVRRKALHAILLCGAILLVLDIQCVRFACRHLGEGDRAHERGDGVLARLEWESAASRPAPFNVYAQAAMARLLRAEKQAESQGDRAEALRLCFSIRGIATSTSGYWPYYEAESEYVAGRIPILAASLGVELSPERYTFYRPIRVGTAHLAILCFFGFALAGFQAIRKRARRSAILLGLLAAVLFVAWLLLLRMA